MFPVKHIAAIPPGWSGLSSGPVVSLRSTTGYKLLSLRDKYWRCRVWSCACTHVYPRPPPRLQLLDIRQHEPDMTPHRMRRERPCLAHPPQLHHTALPPRRQLLGREEGGGGGGGGIGGRGGRGRSRNGLRSAQYVLVLHAHQCPSKRSNVARCLVTSCSCGWRIWAAKQLENRLEQCSNERYSF